MGKDRSAEEPLPQILKGKVNVMKLTKLTAALLTAATAIAPFSYNAPALLTSSPVYAETTGSAEKLPGWIPNDLASTVAFRNAYGTTHIEDGLICLVWKEELPDDTETDANTTERYVLKTNNASAELLHQTSFSLPYENSQYAVYVYKPMKKGDFEVTLLDTGLNTDQKGYKVKYNYSFSINNKLEVTETDIYSWLPDCSEEYSAYSKENGTVSIHNNYIVFCLTSIPQFGDNWGPDSTNKYENAKLCASSSCTMEAAEMYVDGSIDMVYAYRAFNDGREIIKWTRTSGARPDQQEPTPYTLTADCAIFDDAQSILFADITRISFIDYDTGKLIPVPVDGETFMITPTIALKNEKDGSNIYYTDLAVNADSNPFYWDCSPYKNAAIFEIALGNCKLLDGYSLPQNYKRSRDFENGARDVVFFMQKKGIINNTYTANVTLLDYDTGKPIPISNDTDFMFVDPSYIGGIGTDEGVIAKMTSNPCKVENLPFDGYDLAFPQYYNYPLKEGTNQVASEYRKMKQNENGGYDVTYRLKFVPDGDITGDRRFNAEDLTEMQKWLLGDPKANAGNWKGVDYNNDDKLDSRDYALMKQAYIAKRQTPVAVAITETGGYAGIHIEWNVYAEDDKYLLSWWDAKDRYVNNKPVPNEKIIVEISEEQYRDIMTVDYDSMIEEDHATPQWPVWDGINHHTVLTFADGTERKTTATMSSVLLKLDQLMEQVSKDSK